MVNKNGHPARMPTPKMTCDQQSQKDNSTKTNPNATPNAGGAAKFGPRQRGRGMAILPGQGGVRGINAECQNPRPPFMAFMYRHVGEGGKGFDHQRFMLEGTLTGITPNPEGQKANFEKIRLPAPRRGWGVEGGEAPPEPAQSAAGQQDQNPSQSGRQPLIFNITKSVHRPKFDKWALQAAARELLPEKRVGWCLRRRQDAEKGVKLMYSPSVMRAHLKNLIVCGSWWLCAVCQAKIAERRQVELSNGVAYWRESGGSIGFLTLTLAHSTSDTAKKVLDTLLKAIRNVYHAKKWALIADEIVGSVRAIDYTHTLQNGHHFHLHILFFFACKDIPEDFQAQLFELWKNECAKLGRLASRKAFKFRTAEESIAEYIAKYGHKPTRWNLGKELTSAGRKVSRYYGRTSAQLLADFVMGDDEAGSIWLEYAKATKGRRALYYSRGLRKLLHIGEEKTDEELAKENQEDSYLLNLLNAKEWHLILAHDARRELLKVGNSGDAQKVREFLEKLKGGEHGKQD